MRELLIQWLRKAMEMKSGEELYIPCDTKVSQADFYSLLRKELGILRNIDSTEAVKLRVYTTYKDGQFWVVLKKIAVTPLVAFKKDIEGTISRVHISNTKDQERLEMLKAKEVVNG